MSTKMTLTPLIDLENFGHTVLPLWGVRVRAQMRRNDESDSLNLDHFPQAGILLELDYVCICICFFLNTHMLWTRLAKETSTVPCSHGQHLGISRQPAFFSIHWGHSLVDQRTSAWEEENCSYLGSHLHKDNSIMADGRDPKCFPSQGGLIYPS